MPTLSPFALLAGGALLLVACSPVVTALSPAEHPLPPAATSAPRTAPADPADNPAATTLPASTDEPVPPAASPAPTVAPASSQSDCGDPFGGERVRFHKDFWPHTDFCKHTVAYSEIMSGGPPPDGIPSIDYPQFESLAEADQWLEDQQPVIAFEHNGDARAYSLAILIYHEIVNDVVGDLPVTVTFCPLCNAAIVFDRTLPDGQVLDFGTSGNLRNSDLIMYDRQTESWWQQFTGDAIVGELTGARLTFLPAQIVSWGDFKARYPDGMSLSRETGHVRSYGRNPYAGYDTINSNPFLFTGVVDGRLPPMARVAAVELDEKGSTIYVAYPFHILQDEKIVNDTQAGVDLAVFWKGGTVSALDDATIAESEIIGSTAVFNRVLDGQTLTFATDGDPDSGLFIDLETGSTWNIFGQAIAGELEGSQLEQLISHEYFWFAWAAFQPDTVVYAGS